MNCCYGFPAFQARKPVGPGKLRFSDNRKTTRTMNVGKDATHSQNDRGSPNIILLLLGFTNNLLPEYPLAREDSTRTQKLIGSGLRTEKRGVALSVCITGHRLVFAPHSNATAVYVFIGTSMSLLVASRGHISPSTLLIVRFNWSITIRALQV